MRRSSLHRAAALAVLMAGAAMGMHFVQANDSAGEPATRPAEPTTQAAEPATRSADTLAPAGALPPGAVPAADHPSLAHIRAAMAAPPRHFVIVALGDSNTEVNWTTQGGLNWVGLLQAGLFESGHAGRYTVINAGISGDTATNALGRLQRDVLSRDPDLVIISFGGNDVRLHDPETTEASVRELVRRIRAHGPASILIRTPQPSFLTDGDGFEVEPKLEEQVAAIRRAAEAENVALLDVHAIWSDPDHAVPASTYRYDRLHPNARGHRRYYAEIAPIFGLKETLRWEK